MSYVHISSVRHSLQRQCSGVASECCSYFWGWLSDTRGRRSVMIVSLAAMAIVNIAFGFATDLTSAMILRLIAGATNGRTCYS